MTGVDIAILCVVVISALVGLFRGFVKEVFSLANWIAAALLAYLFHDQAGAHLPLGDSAGLIIRGLAGGALVFVTVLIIGSLVSALVHKLVKASGLSGTDRTLGVVFGILRGCVIILLLLIVLPSVSPVAEQSWWTASLLIPVFLEFEEWATGLVVDLAHWVQSTFV